MALTAKRRRWADEYLVDFNGSAAAVRVGYSRKTSKQIASKLKKDPAVAKYIAEKLEGMSRDAGVSAERVMRELALRAFYDPGDVATWTGSTVSLRNSEELSAEERSLVGRIGESQYGVTVTFADRDASLGQLVKILGMITEKREHTGPDGEPLIPWQALRALIADERVSVG